VSIYADSSFLVSLHSDDANAGEARRFLSFDKRQRDLAKAAGLDVKP